MALTLNIAFYCRFRTVISTALQTKYLPIYLVLAILWFPFDWLSSVNQLFGKYFRMFFSTAHDHFIGHTILFLLSGFFLLSYLPTLRTKPQMYLVALVLMALIQESIQAFFRHQLPTFTDFNAFRGDGLGGLIAFVLSLILFRNNANQNVE